MTKREMIERQRKLAKQMEELSNQLAQLDADDKKASTISVAKNDPNELRNHVTEILKDIGVPAHINGYHYLRSAIMKAVNDFTVTESITRVLYPSVAKEFNTTPARVERAIRHAIEVAWDRGNISVLDSYFKNTINPNRGKPTNSEFIATMVDHILME